MSRKKSSQSGQGTGSTASKTRRYVTAAELAAEIPFSTLWLTRRATLGEIPGACQPGGFGAQWVFERKMFWKWFTQNKGAEPWHPQIDVKPQAPSNRYRGEKSKNWKSPLRRRLGL